MDFVKLLFNAHAQMSVSNPISHHEIEIELGAIDLENAKKMNEWRDKSYRRYRESKLPRGSVDVSPGFWISMITEAYRKRIGNMPVLKVPNGCCTRDDCSINQFYDCAAGVLREMS